METKSLFKAIIYGPPQGQGSKSSFPHPKTGNIVTIENSKEGRTWRQEVIGEMQGDQPDQPFDELVRIHLRVYVLRPKGHYKGGDVSRGLKGNAPTYPTGAGKDLDKIERAVGDAAQIARWVVNDRRICWDSLPVYTTDITEPQRVEIYMWSVEQYGPYFLNEIINQQLEEESEWHDHDENLLAI